MMNVKRVFGLFEIMFFNFLWYRYICVINEKYLFVVIGNEKGMFYIVDLKLIFFCI